MTDQKPPAGQGWLAHELDLTVLEITGRDRARFLHSFCTAEVVRRTAGETCEAMVLDGRGKLVGLVQLVFLDDAIRLLTVPGQAEVLRSHLDRFVIREDVRFEDRSSHFRHDFVFLPIGNGPPERPWGPPDGRWAEWGTPGGLAIATRFAGPGWLLQSLLRKSPDGEAERNGQQDLGQQDLRQEDSWKRRSARPDRESDESSPSGIPEESNGIATDTSPASFNELQLHRIRAGSPWFGVDCDGETLPQELQRDALAISFTKGCYLGQETVARIDALGRVNRLLVVLRSGPSADPLGTERALGSADRKAGQLTSVETDEGGVAWGLAMVRRQEAVVGRRLLCGDREFEVLGLNHAGRI